MEIRKLEVMSVAKVLGLTYGIFGFVFGALITLISVLGAAISASYGSGLGLIGVLFGIGAIIALPIFYGILGFIMGALMAIIYNFAASKTGGIKFE